MERREFLRKTLAAGVGIGGLGQGALQLASAAAPGNAIDLFMVSAFSGPFAANGKFGEMGGKLAIKALQQSMGRPINYTTIDTQGNVGVAVRKVQDAISQNHARLFLGGALSSGALAMGKEINRSKGVYVTYVGADEVTGVDCNNATYRWSVPTYGAIQETVGPVADLYPNAKRWYTITPKYVFGDGLLSNAKNLFKKKGIEHVGNSYHSLKEKEFSGYLINAVAAKADVLLLLNFSQQNIDTLRQAASFGLKKKMKIVVAWSAGLDEFRELGADVCEDVFFGSQYWHEYDVPGNKRLLSLARSTYGSVPTLFTAMDYSITTMMLWAIKAAGSTDPAAIEKALDTLKWQGVTGDEAVRAADHQVIKNYFLLKGKPKSKMRDKDDYAEIVSAGKSFVPPAETGCKLA